MLYKEKFECINLNVVILISCFTCLSTLSVAGDIIRAIPTHLLENVHSGSVTWEHELRRNLLNNYDKYSRHETNTSSVVTLAMVINNVDLDYSSSVFSVTCVFSMSWKDDRLKWFPKDYGGVLDTRFATDEVWIPDVTLYNSASDPILEVYSKTVVTVNNTGIAIWTTPTLFKVICEVDVTNWPFDQQNCYLRLGSWTYSMEQIDLRSSSSHLTVNEMNGFFTEWQIVNTKYQRNETKYSCCKELYVDVSFDLTIEKRNNQLTVFILFPSIVLPALVLCLFWMPAQSGEKFILSGIVIFSSCLLLFFFMQQIPVTIYPVPLIVRYYSWLFCLSAITVVLSVFSYNMADVQFQCTRPPPRASINLLRSRIISVLILNSEAEIKDSFVELTNFNYSSSGFDVNNDFVRLDAESELSTYKTYGSQWYLLFSVFERIIFIFYVLFFIVCYFRLLLI